MNKIVEVAQNSKQILSDSAGKHIHCPNCSEEWFSPFDKLYVAAYGKCTSCSSVEEVLGNGVNIDSIIEAAL